MRRLTRKDADRLLQSPGRRPDSSAASGDPLAALLADAAAPATAKEREGEQLAVALFRAAHASASAPPQGVPMPVKTSLLTSGKALVAGGVAVALTGGGIALAATGHLPTLPDQAADRASEALAQERGQGRPEDLPAAPEETDPIETGDPVDADADADSSNDADGDDTDGDETDAPDAGPRPNLAGLCKAVQRGNVSEAGKAMDSAAFAALVDAAGGREGVAQYCVDLIGEAPTRPGRPEGVGRPEGAGKPEKTGRPEGAGRPESTGRPGSTGRPDDAGRPDGTGQPESTGRPEGADAPENTGRPEGAGKPDGAGAGRP